MCASGAGHAQLSVSACPPGPVREASRGRRCPQALGHSRRAEEPLKPCPVGIATG